jgi:hypothetical protein
MFLPLAGHRIIFLLLLVQLLAPLRCAGESATCLAVYRDGGAPAVYQSAHCPRWTIFSGGEGDGDHSSSSPPPRRCHVAAHRGRRRSQEDRAVCALGIRIPFIGTRTIRVSEIALQFTLGVALRLRVEIMSVRINQGAMRNYMQLNLNFEDCTGSLVLLILLYYAFIMNS